jgi:hypothetical protein
MANYNAFQPTIGSTLNQMVSNPLGSSYFNQQLANTQNQAQQVNQRNISNSLANARTGGGLLGNSGAYNRTTAENAMLAGSAAQSNAFNSSLGSALQNRNVGLQGMEGYSPLQTGATTTQQQQEGLGSVLAQVGGIGLNMALPGVNSLLGGNSFSSGYGTPGGGYSGNSGMANRWAAV